MSVKAAVLNPTITRGITFGPLKIVVKDAAQSVIDITGWSVFAMAAHKDGVVDLQPAVTSGVDGEVTIELTDEETLAFPEGAMRWDLVFQTPDGKRIGPYIKGVITVRSIITIAQP